MNRMWILALLGVVGCGTEAVEERQDVFADQPGRTSSVMEAPQVGGIVYDFRRPAIVAFDQSVEPIDFDGSSLICPNGQQMPMEEWFDTLEEDWGFDLGEVSWFALAQPADEDDPFGSTEGELAARYGVDTGCIDCKMCPDGIFVCMNLCSGEQLLQQGGGLPTSGLCPATRTLNGQRRQCGELRDTWLYIPDQLPPSQPDPVDPIDPSPEDPSAGGSSGGGSSSSGGSSGGSSSGGHAGGGGKNGSFSGGGPAGRPGGGL